MKIVLGIGNPGRGHEAARHNVGFRVVDRVAESLGTEIRRRKFRGLVGEGVARHAGLTRESVTRRSVTGERERVILVKPLTYVNAAGECARLVVDFYDVPAGSFLAVLDDVNLSLGTVRCRRAGSSGGHNGMRSVIQHLGTEDFPRLRVGVGRPRSPEDVGRPGGEEERGLTRHVLGGFSRDEVATAEAAECRAAEAVLDWILNGVEHCMNTFNRPAERRDNDHHGDTETRRTTTEDDEPGRRTGRDISPQRHRDTENDRRTARDDGNSA